MQKLLATGFLGFFVSSLLRNNSYCASVGDMALFIIVQAVVIILVTVIGSRNSSGKYAVSNRAFFAKIQTRTTVAARVGLGRTIK